MSRGTLFLVVGPSGAGKDTLIDGARRALAGDPRFVFPRRVITRPGDSGGEAHDTLGIEEFRLAQQRGAFALFWDAHGLCYGIPSTIEEHLVAARHIVVNVSRSVIAAARARYRPLAIIEVWAPTSLLAARLAARGRESVEDMARRLDRSSAVAIEGPDVRRVENSETVADGVSAMLRALTNA